MKVYRVFMFSVFVSVFFIPKQIFCQNGSKNLRLDSLKNELSESNTIRKGDIYNEIIKEFVLNNSDSSLYYIEQSKEYNYDNEYYQNYLKTLKYECDYYTRTGNFPMVIRKSKEAIRFAKTVASDKYLALYYSYLPFAYGVVGDFTNLQASAKKTLFYAEKNKDTTQLIVAHGYLSLYYKVLDDSVNMIKESMLAIDLANELGTFAKESNLYVNLASFYSSKKDFASSLNILEEGLKYAKKEMDSALIYLNMGIVQFSMDSINLAEFYFDQAFLYYKKSNDGGRIGNYYFNKGRIAIARGNYLKAIKLLDQANLYLKKSAVIETIRDVLYAKYEVAKKLKQNNLALQYLEEYKVYNDSIEKMHSINELKETEWKIQLQIQEKEKEFLVEEDKILRKKVESEQRAKKWSLVAFIISILVIVALIVLIIQRKNVVQARRLIRELEYKRNIELKDKELLTIKMQRVNRGNLIEELNGKLGDLKTKLDEENLDSDRIVKDLSMISKNLDSNVEKDWEEFKLYFENLHESFFQKIRQKYPKITSNDEKIVAYIKVNIDTKQIARLLNVSPDTVHTQRYRLRKKMNLPKNSNIRDYLNF